MRSRAYITRASARAVLSMIGSKEREREIGKKSAERHQKTSDVKAARCNVTCDKNDFRAPAAAAAAMTESILLAAADKVLPRILCERS